jgi:hypothetical protein
MNHDSMDIKNFNSMHEFYEYITTMPTSKLFEGKLLYSKAGKYNFTGTNSFDEAVELLLHGWSEEAKILNEKLSKMNIEENHKEKSIYDVVGFQASVPRYLQGIPTNMISKKKVIEKKKTVSIIKDICYSAKVTKEMIEKESLDVLQKVRALENEGRRVNIYILCCCSNEDGYNASDNGYMLKVKIKSASERLNISKVAFPLIHPSMQRRIEFRYTEVNPNLRNGYIYNYGFPIGEKYIREYLDKDDIFIPSISSKSKNY